LAEAVSYPILDARDKRVLEAGVIVRQAMLIAIGIDWDGRCRVLAVELANREGRSTWRDFLLGLKARGAHGVEFGRVRRSRRSPSGASRGSGGGGLSALLCAFPAQRARLRVAPVDDDCLQELRWLGACLRAGEAGTRGTGVTSPKRGAIWPLGSPNC
jgi:hypothetical protein